MLPVVFPQGTGSGVLSDIACLNLSMPFWRKPYTSTANCMEHELLYSFSLLVILSKYTYLMD